MAQYTAPLRDMQFVLHELLNVEEELKQLPARPPTPDADTINQVLEEGGKFASEVLFPLNHSGDREGCRLDPASHEVAPLKASSKPIGNMSRRVGHRWPARRNTATRACPRC